MSGESAGKGRDQQHPQKSQRITIPCKVQRHVRIGKDHVDQDDADDRSHHAGDVAFRILSDEDRGQNVEDGYISSIVGQQEETGCQQWGDGHA